MPWIEEDRQIGTRMTDERGRKKGHDSCTRGQTKS